MSTIRQAVRLQKTLLFCLPRRIALTKPLKKWNSFNMLNSIISLTSTLIVTVVAAFIAQLLYDRFKRPTPNYNFKFEKRVPYQAIRRSEIGFPTLPIPTTEYLENYIYLENYSEEVWLSDVSTEVYFKNKKERTHYQTMGITDNLFNLKIEDLPRQLPLEYSLNRPSMIPLPESKQETIEEKTKTGFFIGSSDMEKLKCLRLIKIKVKYRWNGKADSDIWIFEFTDEHTFRHGIQPSSLWRRVMLLFKRRFF